MRYYKKLQKDNYKMIEISKSTYYRLAKIEGMKQTYNKMGPTYQHWTCVYDVMF